MVALTNARGRRWRCTSAVCFSALHCISTVLSRMKRSQGSPRLTSRRGRLTRVVLAHRAVHPATRMSWSRLRPAGPPLRGAHRPRVCFVRGTETTGQRACDREARARQIRHGPSRGSWWLPSSCNSASRWGARVVSPRQHAGVEQDRLPLLRQQRARCVHPSVRAIEPDPAVLVKGDLYDTSLRFRRRWSRRARG